MPGMDNSVVYAEQGGDIGVHPNTTSSEFSVEFSNDGSSVTSTIYNTSDTAASNANQLVQVAGASSGDSWTQWNVGSTRSFALGIDNSDSDLLKITSAASGTINPSSGTLMMSFLAATQEVGFFTTTPGGNDDVAIYKTKVGTAVALGIANNDNTNAASDAVLALQNGGAAGGNAYVVSGAGGGSNFSFGYLNASDQFAIAQSATLSASYIMQATNAGEVTFPLTPAFLATHTVAQNNITGAGTVATVNFTNEIFDQNSDYNGTNTFTAPVSGRYRFSCTLFYSDVTAAMTNGEIRVVTSNRSYISFDVNYGAIRDVNNNVSYSISVLADMDAADTARIDIIIGSGAGDTVDLQANPENIFFAGELVA